MQDNDGTDATDLLASKERLKRKVHHAEEALFSKGKVITADVTEGVTELLDTDEDIPRGICQAENVLVSKGNIIYQVMEDNDGTQTIPGGATKESGEEKRSTVRTGYVENPPEATSLRRDEALRSHGVPIGAVAVEGSGVSREQARATAAASASTPATRIDSTNNDHDHGDVEGMVQARPVEDDHIDIPSAVADPMAERASNKYTQQNICNGRVHPVTAFISCAVIVAIILGIVFAIRNTNDNDSSEFEVSQSQSNSTVQDDVTLTPVDTDDTSTLTSFAFRFGLPNATIETINNDPSETSPQAKALSWLINDPELDSYSNWKAVQRFALAVLYFSTEGSNWDLNENWLQYSQDECTSWFFRDLVDITVDSWAIGWNTGSGARRLHSQSLRRQLQTGNTTNGAVANTTTKLDSACSITGEYEIMVLRNNNMNGVLPPEIGLLTRLVILDLSNNDGLGGSIPSTIGFLTNLKRLSVERNTHIGQIPTQIGLLTQLERLYMEHNEALTGPLPTEVGNLGAKLQVFSVQRSGLTGYLPTELYRLTGLRELLVQNLMGVTGGTLEGIGALTDLELCIVHDVPFNSTIPAELGSLTKLQKLNLWNTQIHGSVPTELWKLTGMTRLDLEDNFLTGTFPQELSQMSNLELAFLDNNLFSGTLPTHIWQGFPKMIALTVHSTAISGTIPTETGLMTTLEEIWFADMPIQGTIPSEIANMRDLQMLFLHVTDLTGTIPSEFATLDQLHIITLSNTSLTGTVPDRLCGSLHDMEFSCRSVLGVEEQVCAQVELKNFSCDASMLCGCSCAPCSS